MERKSSNSSMITSIGYDVNQSILEIEFSSTGAVWQYYDFPEPLWNDFMNAESHGKFYHSSIKNQYRESRVG
jgi:hypothetical protein